MKVPSRSVFGVMRPASGPVLAGVGIAAALVYLFGLASARPELRLVVKPLPVLALAGWVASRSPGALGRATAIGLALSALGDLLLERGRFLPGLLAFLAAHVAYIAAFLAADRRASLGRLLPFAAWGLAAFALLRPGLGSMTVPVGLYVAVITTMMWRAAARVGSPRVSPDGISGASPGTPALAALAGLGGAVAFGASDTLIAFDRFFAPIPGVRWPIMGLYWIGQLGIAAQAVLGSPGRVREGASR